MQPPPRLDSPSDSPNLPSEWNPQPLATQNFKHDIAETSLNQMEQISRMQNTNFSHDQSLTVHSVGMLRPKDFSTQDASNSVRVIRQTFVPQWAVPPKVLVVEDDATSRRLASRFLQVENLIPSIFCFGQQAENQKFPDHLLH